MTSSDLFFCYVFLSTSFVLHEVSALNYEGIIGGSLGNTFTLPYAALIQGRTNFSEVYENICSGVLIDMHFAVSAAQCFVNEKNVLIPKSYSVVVGPHILVDGPNFRLNIETIYLPGFDSAFDSFNLAVLKVENNFETFLDLHYVLGYNNISLPSKQLKVDRATVYGYGVADRGPSGEPQNLSTWANQVIDQVKHAEVRILSSEECERFYPNVNHRYQVCGQMVDVVGRAGTYGGTCKGDNGAPLIRNGLLLGILGKHSIDCDDKNYSSLYTKVSVLSEFIILAMQGVLLVGAHVYENLNHVM